MSQLHQLHEQQKQQILQHLLDVSDAELSLDELRPEMLLREDLGVDSLAALELAMELEQGFDVALSNEEMEGLKTVGDVLQIIASRESAK